MERCRRPRSELGSSSLSLPTGRHVLRLLISSDCRRDYAYVKLVSNQLQQLEGIPHLPKGKVILSPDSFHLCQHKTWEDPSPLPFATLPRWYCIGHPSAKSFPSLPAISLQVSAFPGINLRRKGIFCAGVWELHIQFPPLTAAGLWF